MGIEALPRTLELMEDSVSGSIALRYIDQRSLPASLVECETKDWHEVVDAIQTLAVRGAPAIGVAGAAALVLYAVNDSPVENADDFVSDLEKVASTISQARPTAVNLSWGVERVLLRAKALVEGGTDLSALRSMLFEEVKLMEREDEATNRKLGDIGSSLLASECCVLTHCNAGSLATVFYGTALGVVYTAATQGKIKRVFADETRPVGQGARLTVWELSQADVPCTLLCDDMAASLMAKGQIDVVLVGADRICANGDVANKIGTYGLAILAHYHDIPFYVVAPSSSIDFSLPSGEQVAIEQRTGSEVATVIPASVEVYNPAFDITPAPLITAIVTERGVFAPEKLEAGYSDTLTSPEKKR